MAKEELLEFDGTVTEVLPDGNYRVTLDNDHQILAYMSGKMRKFRIRTGVGDRVVVEVSPYDLARGRINFRHKSRSAGGGSRRCPPSQFSPALSAVACYRRRLKPSRPERAMTATDRPAGEVDPKLLEILVCPLTKGPLEYDAEKQELISRSAKLAYPIRAGIPIMLPEEARRLD